MYAGGYSTCTQSASAAVMRNASACVWVLIETAVEEIECCGVSAQGASHIAHILSVAVGTTAAIGSLIQWVQAYSCLFSLLILLPLVSGLLCALLSLSARRRCITCEAEKRVDSSLAQWFNGAESCGLKIDQAC